MKTILSVIAVCLFSGAALAQQDPDDPGLPDSLIQELSTDHIDSNGHYQVLFLDLMAVTDDSVWAFAISTHWSAPEQGVEIDPRIYFYNPLNQWDELFDTVLTSESCARTIGFADVGGPPNPPLFTDYFRMHIIHYLVAISADVSPQMVVFDTCQTSFYNDWVPIFMPDTLFIGPLTTVDDEIPMPSQLALSQNYPNPFNSSTTISYALPVKGLVTLSIYNLLGQKVATLFEGVQDAGEHRLVWEASGAPSGVYFYRLAANEYVDTRRMVVIR